MSSTKDGTGQGLIEFLDYAASKGLMNRNTAGAQKSSVAKVLAIEGDHWQETNLREVNVDDQLTRFQNLKKSSYSPSSLRAYESRFRTALEEYFRYLDDPGAYNPKATGRESSSKRARKRGSRARSSPVAGSSPEPAGESPAVSATRDYLITYPFPLRESTMAYLQLPKNLTKQEAERLSRFVQSLALESIADEEPPL